ncbi:MAG: AI-2E family transporter [Burkholderiales bacterium]
MDKQRSHDLHYLWILGAACVAAILLYLLSPILAPFLFAGILAYICDPVADWLERKRVPRSLATVLVMLLLIALFAALLLILIPLFYKEVTQLAEKLPGFLIQLRDQLSPWLKAKLGIELQLDVDTLKQTLSDNWQSAGGVAGNLLSGLKVGGLAVVGLFINLLLIPVVLFYLLRDWDKLVANIDAIIPRRYHERVITLAREVDQVLAEFLRGQISVMFIMSAFYVIGLWIAGLEFALPIGIITGMLVFIPYLGVMVGLVLATLAAFMQFGSIGGVIPVWIVIGLGQAIEGTLVTPKLVGERIGLHPVVVIFALLAFGQLFGFFGVLLALPASAALLVWLRHVQKDYLVSSVYND